MSGSACHGCGEEHDYPWGYCVDCTAALIDLQRAPEHRLNPPEVLEAQAAKIWAYAERATPHGC